MNSNESFIGTESGDLEWPWMACDVMAVILRNLVAFFLGGGAITSKWLKMGPYFCNRNVAQEIYFSVIYGD